MVCFVLRYAPFYRKIKELILDGEIVNDKIRTNEMSMMASKVSAIPAVREKLILEYAPLVKLVAGRLSMYLGYNVEYEDLVSYGIFGLIDAIDKFNFDKNVKFETYASLRIRGAIIDSVRNQLKDKVQVSVYEIQDLVENALIYPGDFPEIARAYIRYRYLRELARSDYGKLVSSADRNTSIRMVFIRSFFVGKRKNPDQLISDYLDYTFNRLTKRPR